MHVKYSIYDFLFDYCPHSKNPAEHGGVSLYVRFERPVGVSSFNRYLITAIS